MLKKEFYSWADSINYKFYFTRMFWFVFFALLCVIFPPLAPLFALLAVFNLFFMIVAFFGKYNRSCGGLIVSHIIAGIVAFAWFNMLTGKK
jgi:hypothetical protein